MTEQRVADVEPVVITVTPSIAWVTTRKAAELVGRSKRSIRRWIDHGDLASRRVGGVIQVRVDHVQEVAAVKDLYRESPTFGK